MSIFLHRITSSDPTAKTGYITDFFGYKGDVREGRFIYATDPGGNTVPGIFMYADRDHRITGSVTYKNRVPGWTYHDEYHLNLKKGWNAVYITGTSDANTKINNSIYTNTKP